MFNSGVNLLAVFNLILFAVCMCLYVLKTKNLWGACGFHAVWNYAQGNIFGLSVSGHSELPSIFTAEIAGPKLLTGGSFGPEASVIVTVIYALIAAFFLWSLRRNKIASE